MTSRRLYPKARVAGGTHSGAQNAEVLLPHSDKQVSVGFRRQSLRVFSFEEIKGVGIRPGADSEMCAPAFLEQGTFSGAAAVGAKPPACPRS